MKSTFRYLLAFAMAAILLAGIEYALMLLIDDFGSCFLHNSLLGNMLGWPVRIFSLLILSAFMRQLFIPAYATLKDRMMERDEIDARMQTEKNVSVAPGKYAFDI